MDDTIRPITLGELKRLATHPYLGSEYTVLTGHPVLLLNLQDSKIAAYFNTSETATLALSEVPCPIIAMTGTHFTAAVPTNVDIVVSSHKEAAALMDNIQRHPFSAMALVQVLRHNEKTDPETGLLVESLAYATLQGGSEFRHYLATRPTPPLTKKADGPAILAERTRRSLTLTLNRPEQHNAMSAEMRDALYDTLQLPLLDDSIDKVIIRGAGNCFCTGGALEEFGLSDDTAKAHVIRSSRSVGHLLTKLSQRTEFQVHKACIGSGMELPAFAARVTAAKNTFFHLPEISMGLIPGAGGTVSLLRRIGRHRLAWMALSGRRIRATTALEWGLIDAIAD